MSDRPFSGPARVVLLAGGFGTRVSHLLPGMPKPMAPVCGKPFLEWVVRFYARHGFKEFVLSTGHLSHVIAIHFATKPVPDVTVACCAEVGPLGTAGGFLNCTDAKAAGAPVWLVANGDSLVVADPRPLVELTRTPNTEAALLGLSLPDAGRYGTMEVSSNGRLRSFREKQPGPGIINAGVYAFSHDAVCRMPGRRPLSFELDVFPTLAAAGRTSVQVVSAPFIDIGTPETLAEAEAFITANKDRF